MTIRLFIVLFLFLGIDSYAQQTDNPQEIIAKLKSNPNITWIGEIMTNYTPKYDAGQINSEEKTLLNKSGIKSINRVKVLKLQLENPDEDNWDTHDLNVKLLNALDEMDCYKDAGLTQKHSEKSMEEVLTSKETMTTFDPETFEEVVQVIVNEVNPQEIYSFQLRQLVYYDKAAKTLKTMPLAIAPLLTEVTKDGGVISSKPLFWFSPKDSKQVPNLNDGAIDYAKRIYCQVEENDIKLIKGEVSMGELLVTMLEDIKKTPKEHYIGDVFGSDGNRQMNEKEVRNLGSSVDTVITFDPNTFEKIVQVVVNEIEPKDLTKLRLIQDWVWNKDKKELEINFIGFAPLIHVPDHDGNYHSYRALLFRRPDKDK